LVNLCRSSGGNSLRFRVTVGSLGVCKSLTPHNRTAAILSAVLLGTLNPFSIFAMRLIGV
jgi:hypothetical protein